MISGQEIVLPMHVVMSKFNYANLTTKLTNYSSFCWRNICSYNHVVIIALSECKTMQPCLEKMEKLMSAPSVALTAQEYV